MYPFAYPIPYPGGYEGIGYGPSKPGGEGYPSTGSFSIPVGDNYDIDDRHNCFGLTRAADRIFFLLLSISIYLYI